MKTILSILTFFSFLFVIAILSSLTIVGGGYVIKTVAASSLFEGSVLFLATIFTVVVAVGFAILNKSIKKINGSEEDAWEWNGRTSEKHDNEHLQFQSKKVGRNSQCHCGSGKKYKQCCFQKTNTRPQNEIPI